MSRSIRWSVQMSSQYIHLFALNTSTIFKMASSMKLAVLDGKIIKDHREQRFYIVTTLGTIATDLTSDFGKTASREVDALLDEFRNRRSEDQQVKNLYVPR